MDPEERLRLVSKAQYNEQVFVSVPRESAPLAVSSLRVQTISLALTSNSLAYCAAGDILHWWSTFPIPSATPSPYNDSQIYSISPGWGYCKVIDSTVVGIEVGRFLYGFVPISSHLADLQLRQVDDLPDHWIETSPHRSKVMSLYQRYFLLNGDFSISPKFMFTTVIKPIWEAGYVLARYVFSQNQAPIHPFGNSISPWTETEADLSDACIVCIAGGTKTSRSFLQQLAAIDAGKRSKFSVIEVTGGPSGCETYLKAVPFQHKLINYDQITPDVFEQHRKFVLLNFGGRDNALSRTAEAVSTSNPDAKVIIVQIGSEARVATKDELAARRRTAVSLKAVQMNTTAIKDIAMARISEKQYFEEMNTAFEDMLTGQMCEYDGTVLGVNLKVVQGLEGEHGVEGSWKRLCAGQIAGHEGLVVRLDV